MSEYFLADVRARERAGQRANERERGRSEHQGAQAQDMKVTLLGDFLFPTTESQGCDPYNSTQGKSAREAWKTRRDRR
jgi:hypothetical protein